jgi:hypothetical protein
MLMNQYDRFGKPEIPYPGLHVKILAGEFSAVFPKTHTREF